MKSDFRDAESGSRVTNERRPPLGTVKIVSSESVVSAPPVGIWAFNGIYQALGATAEAFAAWEDKYGFDSLGSGDYGEIFIPAYPVFSKVAWMYVDPVDLSPSETEALIDECDRELLDVTDPGARKELTAIRDLASDAVRRKARVRFGHP
jgi:hypothetical protein